MEGSKRSDLEREITVLQGRRESRFLRVQRVYDMIKDLHVPAIRERFDALCLGLDETVREFRDIVDRLNDLNLRVDKGYVVDYQALDSVEELACFIRHAAQQSRTVVTKTPVEDSVPLAQLPKIELPVFTGDPIKWPVFHDTFASLIHNNTRLDEVAKVHYLFGSLRGRALEVCAGMAPTAANYAIIWDSLVRKYQNPRLQADCHFQRMVEFRPLTSESAEGLSSLAETFSTSFRALTQLALPNLADFFAMSILLSKMDPSSRKSFEMACHAAVPSLDEVITFLQHHASALGRLNRTNLPKRGSSSNPLAQTRIGKTSGKPQQALVVEKTDSISSTNGNSRSCALCRGPHQIYTCETFVKASMDQRWQLVEGKKLCFNCLSDVHRSSACKSKSTCRKCHKRHHSMLHRDLDAGEPGPTTSAVPTAESEPAAQNLITMQHDSPMSNVVVVLPTVVAKIATPKGEATARLLVDSGSQAHLITVNCCRRLGIPIHKRPGVLGGIGGVVEPVRGRARFTLQSRISDDVHLEVDALVIRRITTAMPSFQLRPVERQKFQELPLADPTFDRPGEIDGVLGAAAFAEILNGAAPVCSPGSPSAVDTTFGFLIIGPASVDPTSPALPKTRTLCTFMETGLDEVLRKFWEMEDVAPSDPNVLVDESEKLFSRTTKRTTEGRYVVHLPFSEFPPRLGESFAMAKRRWLALERQLSRSPVVSTQYHDAMRDYLEQGHISVSPLPLSTPGFFIPHFAVYKESTSTPVRIVFDASCKTSHGTSLNDVLYTGPKLQKDIQNILLRFRVHPIAVIADIKQMYRNILVCEEHRRYQRLLWRASPQEPLQVFQLNCVPFGLNCAPFLALRTIKQLAEDEKRRFPLAARIANADMYVDDIITSAPESEFPDLIHQLVGLFKAGGFTLAKWKTNSAVVVRLLPDESPVTGLRDMNKGTGIANGVKVLGLHWNAATDQFLYSQQVPDGIGTKRQMLSVLARIWDPLGFLAPVTLLCKVLVKKLWMAKSGWDEPPPDRIGRLWSIIVQELPQLNQLMVPRYIGNTHDSTTKFVGFADSSETGYGAVIYAVTHHPTGEARSTLLIAKSKVTPMKPCSIPRLELCAATLLSRMMQLVRRTWSHVPSTHLYALTDSEDVLHWLAKPPSAWKTFVANRVAFIQESVAFQHWYHVPGGENISDIISRGVTPQQLVNHPKWICGPPWLVLPVEEWPISKPPHSESNPLEARTLLATEPQPSPQPVLALIERISSWSRLLRVVVQVLRFVRRLPWRPHITAADLEQAEHRLVQYVQRDYFSKDLQLLAEKKVASPQLRPLAPFLHDGCIRVGGRLENSALPFDQKHPLLLPKKSRVGELIVDHYHRVYLHAGPTLLLSVLRRKFWILSARNLVRRRIRACLRCFRANPRGSSPLIAPLPLPRLSEAKPFSATGVDYAGPFRITVGKYRGVRSQKAYICLFICMATKAVHLELAADLSTSAFLQCFRRFVARRGPISIIHSDCGTNFVGAKSRLQEHERFLRGQEFTAGIGNFLATNSIEWKFNPPSAPPFGGLWEAAVRRVKAHLVRVVGLQLLSWDEFYTLLTQIESVLNSRPLAVLSPDPNEPEAITPAHFLNLTPLRYLPLAEEPNPGGSLKTRLQLVSQMLRDFWRRWRQEYLVSLQPRRRRTCPSDSLTVGTVVVVHEDNSPPLHWPLGVIEGIHPGADGVVRVVSVRVGGTVFRRPAVRVFPIPNQ